MKDAPNRQYLLQQTEDVKLPTEPFRSHHLHLPHQRIFHLDMEWEKAYDREAV